MRLFLVYTSSMLYLIVLCLPCCHPLRLFDPSFGEQMHHHFLTPKEFKDGSKNGTNTYFLKLCEARDLPEDFPLFLCPLMFLLSAYNDKGYEKLYNDTASAITAIKDPKNHPCAKEDKSCVIVFLPFDRILFGCSKIDKIPKNWRLGDFRYIYVVQHNFSEAEPCIYDEHGKEVCTLDTTFVNTTILIEEHKCCCRSGYCAVMLYDQGNLVLPLLKTVVDLEEVVPHHESKIVFKNLKLNVKGKKDENKITLKKKKTDKFTTKALGSPKKRSKRRPSPCCGDPPRNLDVLFVMPVFVILFCVFCAAGISNMCGDQTIDELHASGIDVIRSEEGRVRETPRSHAY
ncbi:unnamed protein product [Cylicocyclus nassatus]|uniref:Uncharacterized protein n=1 Tax=Cylicocyclus nassatus TaxID=53992 RepID=A0AA36MDH4_CYLNA|nr:unnamed protein product [Cylicocyclus nassatus]